MNNLKLKWVNLLLEVLKFDGTKGAAKIWQGASVEGSGEFIHESQGDGFFHRIAGGTGTGVESNQRTAQDSSSSFYRRASFGPS